MSRQKLRRDSDRKGAIVGTIVASEVKASVLSDFRQRRRFLEQYFAHVPYEDLEGRSTTTMAKIALAHLELGEQRRKGQVRLRIFNADEKQHGYRSNYTFIEIVNDDMPFLVNSVAAAVKRHGLTVHITIHPVIRVLRNADSRVVGIADRGDASAPAESFIRLAIDRETDPQELDSLKKEIRHVLADIRLAVRDWKKMLHKLLESRELLELGPDQADEALRGESQAFLEWLAKDHFTFLGYREYRLSERGDKVFLRPVEKSGLGLLSRKSRRGKTIELTDTMRRLSRSKDWLILTKANSRSTIHRNAYLDYIGVKLYDEYGKVRGERRFIGLFASTAYSEPPRNIPLLRQKLTRVFEQAKVEPVGHRGKALLHILNTYPRDELFHASVRDLARTALGILNLQDRQRVRLFIRRDRFRRFFSCLVYVPREKYTTLIRRRIETILKDELDGTELDSSVQISDSALARVHMIVHTPSGDRPRISIRRIEERISEVVITWLDRLRDEVCENFGLDDGPKLFRAYRDVFPPGYQTHVTPREACSDIQRIEEMLELDSMRSVELYAPENSPPGHMHFIIYSFNDPLMLSRALPLLEHMGVAVYSENPYELQLRSGDSFWIQDFHLHQESSPGLDVAAVATRFEECFIAALTGKAESDGLNQLVLDAGLDWRETTLLRCYTKYLLQLRMPFSQAYMKDVLLVHRGLVGLLVEQFKVQFDPELSAATRQRRLRDLLPRIRRAINKARNIDEDRILNAYAGAIDASLRCNYFQAGPDGEPKDYISIKIDPTRVPEMPQPRPKYEIFVYSTEVEGVHLRSGDIARGGLRWSDRREDFRTEVLGLMKAQVVKNTIIVPTGAKGGFFPKRLPEGDRDLALKVGTDCYRSFVSGLLDLTDNVVGDKIVPPQNVVRRDGDDAYLVVAADKGTATFSDVANEISSQYKFWLDDAFASGGSAGYDHKKMGITARGAWEAVKRHFRELGIDTQKDPFTVAGIGDMSGDVFGNGMLLSRKIKLVAAFDHQHIFLDPDPDTAASFKERRRLFRQTRSNWSDYDSAFISKGGGVYSRQAKTIRLSPEARKLLDTEEAAMRPDELISAILRMPVDLLWNGGIGTYVKASSESHADIGDRSNDSVRVNADELGCKVVGEGGNLGMSQLARIEFSVAGGRVNTDFIDNSAGVDTSDREVNIKILLSDVMKQKKLSRARRNELLASMKDDVASLVLRDNYLQTQSISMSEIRSAERIGEIARLIAKLESTGLLNRGLEYLPDETEIEDRRARKQGFTRPELAVVMSYAKIDLYRALIHSGETLDDFLIIDPQRYFPQVLRRRYPEFILRHRLRRQILATLITNDLVNRMGPAFVRRVQDDTGADLVTVARAYTIAHKICRARSLFRTIEGLDNQIPAKAQIAMMFEVSRELRHACYWLIEQFGSRMDIESLVARLKDGMTVMYGRSSSTMSPNARRRHERAAARYVRMGVPEQLAQRMSALLLTRAALDITDLAHTYKRDVLETARLYAAFNHHLGLFWLHAGAEDLSVRGHWQAMARNNLREEFFRLRRQLAERFLARRSRRDIVVQIEAWLDEHRSGVTRFREMVDEMKLRGDFDFATLSVAAQELRQLIAN